MTAALGVWRQEATGDGVLYRWKTDTGSEGFLLFDPGPNRFRPADAAGRPIGDYQLDGGAGEATGHAEGFDRTVFLQVVGSILRAYRRAGEPPATAHATYY